MGGTLLLRLERGVIFFFFSGNFNTFVLLFKEFVKFPAAVREGVILELRPCS